MLFCLLSLSLPRCRRPCRPSFLFRRRFCGARHGINPNVEEPPRRAVLTRPSSLCLLSTSPWKALSSPPCEEGMFAAPAIWRHGGLSPCLQLRIKMVQPLVVGQRYRFGWNSTTAGVPSSPWRFLYASCVETCVKLHISFRVSRWGDVNTENSAPNPSSASPASLPFPPPGSYGLAGTSQRARETSLQPSE